jgi:single-strand DNA-binding protein
MNQVALVGNITDDPELRYTQSGASLAGFTVAVSHGSKHNGEWQDVTDGFLRCTAWRSVAENASGTLKKGMRVFVPGKLVQRTWQDDSGNKTSPLERVPKASTSLPYGTVMSMTTVPSSLPSCDSVSSIAFQGTARITRSAVAAASSYEVACAAPVAGTTFAAFSGFLDPKTTSCWDERAVAKPRPIFPVPMMAIFMTVLRLTADQGGDVF